MRLRLTLAPTILIPAAATILVVVGLAMFLSASSNTATVEDTLADQQNQMIQVLAQQFAGGVRFAKMDTVTEALTNYQKDPTFGLAGADVIDAQGKPLLQFGGNPRLDKVGLDVGAEALAKGGLATRVAGNYHYAAFPAVFGKDSAVVGAVAMVWDISIRRAGIISLQLQNGLIALAIAVAGIIGLAALLMWRVTRPLVRLTAASADLAEGKLDIVVDDDKRGDELGDLAGAVEVFRANALKVQQLTAAEAARIIADQQARQAMMQQLQAAFGEVVDAAVAGDFSRRVGNRFDDAELNALAQGINQLCETVDRGLGETGEVLAALAEADLSRRMDGEYSGAFARLKTDTNRMADRLAEIVGQLKRTSFDLKTATGEILSGANDLSERTTRQAATIEETSAAMEQVATTVLENARRAEEASANAATVTRTAEDGGQVMHQATDAMERITNSSSKISNIIGLIDDIAFQTNLLALNASVEAARAGEAGKGFAVVAVEVRRLAQSAAEASSEVKALIEQSGAEVKGGSKLVAEAAGKLEAMLEGARRNHELLQGIAGESRAQASSIEEVTVAVRQLDEMTQHNAALVEETNAAIEQTEAQAVELDKIVAIFSVDTEAPVANLAPAMPPRGIKGVQEKVRSAARSYLSNGNAAIDKDWAGF